MRSLIFSIGHGIHFVCAYTVRVEGNTLERAQFILGECSDFLYGMEEEDFYLYAQLKCAENKMKNSPTQLCCDAILTLNIHLCHPGTWRAGQVHQEESVGFRVMQLT